MWVCNLYNIYSCIYGYLWFNCCNNFNFSWFSCVVCDYYCLFFFCSWIILCDENNGVINEIYL